MPRDAKPGALGTVTRMGRQEAGPSPRNDAGPSRSTGPQVQGSPWCRRWAWGGQRSQRGHIPLRSQPGGLSPRTAGEVISYASSVEINHVRQNKWC